MNMTFEKDPEHGWAVLTGCDCLEEDIVHIPATVTLDDQELRVREIGKHAFKKCPARCIIVPDIYKIQDSAFKDTTASCIGVIEDSRHSVLPLSLQTIGSEAFSGTQNLQDVTFPSTSLDIGDGAFFKSACRSLLFANTTCLTVGISAFEKSNIVEFFAPQLISLDIPDRCFAECSSLNHFYIEHGRINRIGTEGFLNCKNLLQLPAKQPMDHVGSNAFAGSSVAAIGMFRTLHDYYQAFGSRHLTEAVLDILVPHRDLPFAYIQENVNRIRMASEIILKQLLNVERTENDLVLLNCAVKNWRDQDSGEDLLNQLFLYPRETICKFHRITDFDITDHWKLQETLHSPFRSLSSLTEEEVLLLLEYDHQPYALPPERYTMDNMLNAELLASACTFVDESAMDYLLGLVEEHMNNTSTQLELTRFDIPNKEIPSIFDDGYCTKKDVFCVLRDGILFSRLAIYQELKNAHLQLSS